MTLVIMAAGMATRFGSLKQKEQLGPSGETIIDYAIYDAIVAGFSKVVVIVREDTREHFAQEFRKKFGEKIKLEFVSQEINKVPNNFAYNPERQKPWGTGHALLVAKGYIDEPFCIINGDDFYGREAYQTIINYIAENPAGSDFAMIGYDVEKTLSNHGTVSRGMCTIDENSYLVSITERTAIKKENDKIVYIENEKTIPLTETLASMNFWMLRPEHLAMLEEEFCRFLEEKGQELKSEFYLPSFISTLIAKGYKCKVLNANSEWFGVTYKEDAESVRERLRVLAERY